MYPTKEMQSDTDFMGQGERDAGPPSFAVKAKSSQEATDFLCRHLSPLMSALKDYVRHVGDLSHACFRPPLVAKDERRFDNDRLLIGQRLCARIRVLLCQPLRDRSGNLVIDNARGKHPRRTVQVRVQLGACDVWFDDSFPLCQSIAKQGILQFANPNTLHFGGEPRDRLRSGIHRYVNCLPEAG